MQSQADTSLSLLKILIPVFSGIVGSLATLIGNHFYTNWKDRREKRERIFKTLMSTRGFKLFPAHVEALCAVEVEWGRKGDEKVRSAWKAYNHHLNKQVPDDLNDPANVAWRNDLDELFADLIVALGESIGKPQDKTDVKTGAYGARLWAESEFENILLRKAFLNVLAVGKSQAIPVLVQYDQLLQPAPATEKSNAAQTAD